MRNHPRQPTELVDPALPWEIGEPIRGERHLTQLMEEVVRDPHQLARAIEVGTQLARARALQGKLAEAESVLQQAERMLRSVSDLVPRLRALLERGRILVLRKTPVEAGSRFLEAWLLATASNETYFAIDAAQMMSVIDAPKKQVAWILRALELAESSTDPRVRSWCGHLYHDLGLCLEESLQLEAAKERIVAASDCFRAQGDRAHECMARCSLARVLRLMNQAEQALAIQNEVRINLQSAGRVEGIVFEEIAECLSALGRSDDAVVYFGKAYDLLSKDQWLTDNQPSRIKRLKTMGTPKQRIEGRS